MGFSGWGEKIANNFGGINIKLHLVYDCLVYVKFCNLKSRRAPVLVFSTNEF